MTHSEPQSPSLPFLIFTPERTGSTTLTCLLNCHPSIQCAFEPFNPGYSGLIPYRCRTVLASQGLDAAVKSLWTIGNFNGLKHVRHTDGWPFAGQPQLNDQLLLNTTAAVIFMTRRNALQRAISGQISEQMRLWMALSDTDRTRIRAHVFAPLDIGKLRAELLAEQAEFVRTRQLLAASGKPWCQVAYEDFFAPQLSLEVRLRAVQALFEFLQLDTVADPARLTQMEWLFDPANTGFQNVAAYERIPNIQQVENELGCEETGFVFDSPRTSRHRVCGR